MIAPRLQNMAIKYKLISIIMLTCIVALMLAGIVFIIYERIHIRRDMVENLSTQAAIVADNCKAALAFDDAEDAQETLKALRAEPSIVFACIYNKSSEVFAQYHREGTDIKVPLSEPQASGYRFDNNFLAVFQSIILDGQTIGTVSVWSDLNPLKVMLKRNTMIIIAVLALSSLAAYLISSRLQRVISTPILSLAEVAKVVSEKKDYSTRAVKQSNDELGLLIEAFNEMLEQIQQQNLALVEAKEQLETRVRERTAELTTTNEQLTTEVAERKRAEADLKDAQKKLVDTAHRAGMAEVATDVLHNVGNVLNSINISTTLITEKVSSSELTNLKQLSDIINEHIDDLGTFLTEDPRGKHIPVYLSEVSTLLIDEQADIINRIRVLAENVQHIKNIVSMQQSYAKVSGLEMPSSLVELVEDAVQINSAGLQRHGSQIVREFEELPAVEIDKQKVLQILVNLISNAKYALSDSDKEEKILTIRVHKHCENRVRIDIIDNGIGIPEENLTKIFSHGFTTKKHGHGFGLHSGALAAKEIGGSLAVHSDGIGKGSTFTLELPFRPVKVMP